EKEFLKLDIEKKNYCLLNYKNFLKKNEKVLTKINIQNKETISQNLTTAFASNYDNKKNDIVYDIDENFYVNEEEDDINDARWNKSMELDEINFNEESNFEDTNLMEEENSSDAVSVVDVSKLAIVNHNDDGSQVEKEIKIEQVDVIMVSKEDVVTEEEVLQITVKEESKTEVTKEIIEEPEPEEEQDDVGGFSFEW
ncbi:hypothetical protein HK099_001461, partial [Clydaea vesicula]